jgi:hypothetical protein
MSKAGGIHHRHRPAHRQQPGRKGGVQHLSETVLALSLLDYLQRHAGEVVEAIPANHQRVEIPGVRTAEPLRGRLHGGGLVDRVDPHLGHRGKMHYAEREIGVLAALVERRKARPL